MYKYFIESVTVEGWTSMECNTYPQEKAVCERLLEKQLRAISYTERKVVRYWIEEVTK